MSDADGDAVGDAVGDAIQDAIQDAAHGVYLLIHARPGAKRTGFCGMHDGCLKIAVQAAPRDGRANEALRRFLATELGLARRDIEVTGGQSSRRKRLFLAGDPEALRRIILDRFRHA
ncbi:MAG: DUF167 domain-containing protein [Mariprofundaceae bacterium]